MFAGLFKRLKYGKIKESVKYAIPVKENYSYILCYELTENDEILFQVKTIDLSASSKIINFGKKEIAFEEFVLLHYLKSDKVLNGV